MQHTKNSFTLCFLNEFQPHSKQNKKESKQQQDTSKGINQIKTGKGSKWIVRNQKCKRTLKINTKGVTC